MARLPSDPDTGDGEPDNDPMEAEAEEQDVLEGLDE